MEWEGAEIGRYVFSRVDFKVASYNVGVQN